MTTNPLCKELFPRFLPESNTTPVLLFHDQEVGHTLHWIGASTEDAFRCNIYLVQDQNDFYLIDPGGLPEFPSVLETLSSLTPPETISGLILSHQDPDVAASISKWFEINPDIKVYSSPRTHVLLGHYGNENYNAVDIETHSTIVLGSGTELRFIPAPFLHFPGAFVTYDAHCKFLMSGDIWASLAVCNQFTMSDFNEHIPKMDLFHKDYMASNIATRGFVRSLANVPIRAILPQHGAIIGPEHVNDARKYLEDLECGLDLIYGDSICDELPPFDPLHENDDNDQAPATTNFSHISGDLGSLRDALRQAERIGRLRDSALKNLKETEKSLLEREAQLSEAQFIGRMGHWHWNILNDTVTWSEQIYRIFGIAPWEFDHTYEGFLQHVHPDDKTAVIEHISAAIDKDTAISIDHRIVLSDGEVRYVHEQGRIARDADNKATNMLGILQDITERKMMEEALRYSEQTNRTLLESAGEGIVGINSQGLVTFANPAAIELLGFDNEDDVLGKNSHELFHHSHADGRHYPVEECQMQKAYHDNKTYKITGEVLWRADGSCFDVEYVTAPLHRDGAIDGVAVVFTDITYRKQAEQQIALSEQRFRDIVMSSGDWVWEIDRDLRYCYASERVKDILGYSPEELIGKSPFDLMIDGEKVRLNTYFNKIIKSKSHIADLENWNLTKDGSKVCLLTNAVPMFDKNGSLIGYRGVGKDITERKNLENKLVWMASHDSLTGLLNRREFETQLDLEFNRAQRYDRPLSLMLLDIDYFKKINDNLGHQTGDDVLREFASQLTSFVRKTDLLARYGGEEFIVVLPETDCEEAHELGERLVKHIEQHPFNVSDSQPKLSITVSIGVTTLLVEDEMTINAFIKSADDALYFAKNNGRNQLRSYCSKGRI